MKYNDTIRLIGIVCIIYGFPLLKAIFSHEILFEFFHCSSWVALIIYLCFIVAGVCMILFTKPFSKRKKAQK